MRLATVLGQVVATVKEPGLDRFTLLVVQDAADDTGSAPGAAYVAVDLIGAGVIDPVKVTRSAVEHAGSIAAMLLTTEALVVEKPEEEAEDHDHGHGHSHHHGHTH